MPPSAFALVGLFAVLSVVVGILAWWLGRAVGGPRRLKWAIPPIVVAFVALYLVGHRFGVVIGPEIPIFGFQVALLGDIAIALMAALVVALLQAAMLRSRSPLA